MTMTGPLPPGAPETVPIGKLLSRVARELRELASQAEGLQSALSPHIAAPGGGALGAALELQALDHMNQTLAGLAQFVGTLSAQAGDHPVDLRAASGGILLAALGARLRGDERAAAAAGGPTGGECDFF
jgi:hypothetical protein